MKKIVLLGLLLAVLLFTACAKEEPPADTPESGQISGAVTDREVHEFGTEQTYATITLGTLTLIYEGENAAAEAINADLQSMMEQYLADTADQDAMFYSDDNTLNFTHERAYSLAYLGDDYISVLADGYDDNPTAAHANSYRLGYVYDRHSGERVYLADILPTGFEDRIQTSVVARITAAGEADSYYPGYADQIKAVLAEENWYIKDDTLYVIFNPYRIAPAALGILEFPYNYLAG